MEKDPILRDINAFLKKTGMAKTIFGINSVGDANLVPQVEKGRELRRSTRKKIADYIIKAEAKLKFAARP